MPPPPPQQGLLHPCGFGNQQKHTHLTFPLWEENGAEGGRRGPDRGGRDPVPGWPEYGSALRGVEVTDRTPPLLASPSLPSSLSPPAPNSCPPSPPPKNREVSRRLRPGSPTLCGVTFRRSRTRGRGKGRGGTRRSEGRAPARKVGGGGGCQLASPLTALPLLSAEAASRRAPPPSRGRGGSRARAGAHEPPQEPRHPAWRRSWGRRHRRVDHRLNKSIVLTTAGCTHHSRLLPLPPKAPTGSNGRFHTTASAGSPDS